MIAPMKAHTKIKLAKQHFAWTLVVSALMSWGASVAAQIALPKTAQACPGNEPQWTDFAGWWVKGGDGGDGSVGPPDNLNATPVVNCDFYMLAQRMFLWLTSPAPSDKLHIFETPIFYQVSPADPQKERKLLVNSADLNRPSSGSPSDLAKLKKASVSITQFDSQGDAVVLDSQGKVYSFVDQETSKSAAPIIHGPDGQQTEIERTDVARDRRPQDGGPLFFNGTGKRIGFEGRPDGLLRDSSDKEINFDPLFKKFFKNGQAFFLDQAGKVIATERGVGSQPVLMAQARNKLVYYTIEVNDVYAFFLTGTKTIIGQSTKPVIGGTHFPIAPAELSEVETFAETFANQKLPHPKALAVEAKFAWIEAEGLPNEDQYITTWANIPKFIKADPKHWKRDGWQPTKLALVGMHIVFGVNGHEEMIWATFEHINNAPDPVYCYLDDHNNVSTSPPSSGGKWLFSPGKSIGEKNQNVVCEEAGTANVNIQHMYLSGDDIYARRGDKIEPTNVLRINPWGVPPSDKDGDTISISLNRSVRGKLPGGDARRNYVMIGATWRYKGYAFQEGATRLANTTMETFFQTMGGGCLACHQGSSANMLGSGNGGVSHIYCATSPLPGANSSPVPAPVCRGAGLIAPGD
jgi:hypothetical protein